MIEIRIATKDDIEYMMSSRLEMLSAALLILMNVWFW